MRNIVIAYDGSDSSCRAVQYVIDFAAEVDSSTLAVHLVNVQQEPLVFGEYVTAEMIDQMSKNFIEKGQELLKDPAARLETAHISCKPHVCLGNVAEQVRDVVAREGCDTVVMGTRGLNSLTGFLLGSVATRVIHQVPVPVMLVK